MKNKLCSPLLVREGVTKIICERIIHFRLEAMTVWILSSGAREEEKTRRERGRENKKKYIEM